MKLIILEKVNILKIKRNELENNYNKFASVELI